MTYTRWAIGMLIDQGPQTSVSLAGITGWPVKHCERLLDRMRKKQLIKPVGQDGRCRRWALISKEGALLR